MDGQKCEHPQCRCYVDLGMMWCSDRCKELDQKDGDAGAFEKCGCKHAECER